MLDRDIRRLLDTVFLPAADAVTPDVAALRAAAERAPELFGGPVEPVASVRDCVATGADGRRVRLRVYHPEPDTLLPLVVFAHGGGWVTGSLDSHDRLCRMLVNRMRATVAAVDYARAPEHRHPAALDDVDAAWHWCREEARALHVDALRMAVSGDSSGGNLAAALTLRLRRRHEAQPCMQLLLYPALDAHASSASYVEFAKGYNLAADTMRWYWHAYAGDADLDDPELAPLAAKDLAGLAPAVIASVHADVLRDDGLRYAQRLREAGVPVDLVPCPGMVHGFLRWCGEVPAARALIDTICDVARRRLHAAT